MRVISEGPVRITKATVDAAWRRRTAGQRLVVRDLGCRGLALVVNPTGMTWRFDYKPRGMDPVTGRRFPTRSVTIGSPGTHSPDGARDAANAIKGQAKTGADPAAERRVRVAADAARRAGAVERLMEEYARALPRRPKLRGSGLLSAKHVAEELANVRAAMAIMKAGQRTAGEVGAMEIRVLLRAESERPATARARFGAVSRFFDWCQDEGHVAVNPCALVAKARRPRAAEARHQFLPLADLARLWHAAAEAQGFGDVHCDLVRFLLAVPCRRGEAGRMEWPHVDLAAGVWSQPGKLTKNRDPHRLHLHPLALGILRARHAAAGAPSRGLVFPAPVSGRPLDVLSDMKAALDAASGLTGWRWHDFRRSFATALGEAGVAEPVVDAVLNHRQAATRGGVLGVYQRASRWPEQRRAMEAWGALLAAAIEGREAGSAKVVALRPAGG